MKFTQSEIEKELANTVPNGIKRDIARETHIYESIVYAYFNPYDERKSPQFQTLQIQAALDELHPEVGEAHWQALERLREASKPASKSGLCLKTETAKLGMETADVSRVVLTEAPLYTQLLEATQARDQAERTVKAILEAIHAEQDAHNGKRTRLPVDISEKVKARRR